MVDVAEEKVVDWSVPIAGELVPGDAVPPVCIEATVRKVSDLREEIQDTFPDNVPSLGIVSIIRCILMSSTYHHVLHHKWEDQVTQYPGK